MKALTAVTLALATSLRGHGFRAFARLALVFVATIVVFSVGFHAIMETEGRSYSWWTSIYWTVVTMSTLGFGDIVFTSDLGRVFSIVVLLTGAILILVLMPFTFIQLIYVPWRTATREAQAPRKLGDEFSGHLLLTGHQPIDDALIHRAQMSGMRYAVIVEDVEEAISLREDGYETMVGKLDDPLTYTNARAEDAALVFTSRGDQANCNVLFTLREVAPDTLAVATADSPDAVDVLGLAGASHVLRLGDVLGHAFARRILAPTARCSAISTFEDLVIAEASAAGTSLVGTALRDLELRERFGISVVGLWNRGKLQIATPDLVIEETSILLLAGREEQLEAYDAAHAPEAEADAGESAAHDGHDANGMHPVVIIGGGRVGRATATSLAEAELAATIVERDAQRVRAPVDYVIGDAADLEVLRSAGLADAPAVVITTHDDDINVFLTLYARKLRPRAEVLARATLDRNLMTMHRAGADFVLSYASVGATEVWNTLSDNSTLLLAEGLVVFRVEVPASLVDKPLRNTTIPEDTGCSVIAVRTNGDFRTDIDLDAPLRANTELVLIGDSDAEDRFLSRYVATQRRRRFSLVRAGSR